MIMKIKLLTISTCFALLFAACDSDNENITTTVDSQHFFFVNSVDYLSAFAGTFNDLSETSVDNSNAYEYTYGVYPFVYENTILLPEGTKGDIIYQLIRNNNGEVTQGPSLNLEQDANPGEITFIDAETAYASLCGRGKIVILTLQRWYKQARLT